VSKVVHIAVGVIRNAEGSVLIALRPAAVHQGGLWEFPGGKVELGESVRDALVRELQEELAITPTRMSPLIQIRHDYEDKSVLLDVWEVSRFDGEACGNEGQAIRWVTASALPDYDFPAANRPIITAAQLPRRLMITPEVSSLEDLLALIGRAIKAGADGVQLRQKCWTDKQWLDGVAPVKSLCSQLGVALILNSPPAALAESADGLHLSADSLRVLAASGRLRDRACELKAQGVWLSASCHDKSELTLAQTHGLDWVSLSPVAATLSHPEQAPMGWGDFASLVSSVTLPVFALGGVTLALEECARNSGAQGIAAIRAW